MNASHASDLDRRLARDPIAIVGLSALYPKSRDLREFWANVVSAADCIEDVPATHWDVSEHYDSDPSAPDKTYSKRGGFIPTVPFNPLEFERRPTPSRSPTSCSCSAWSSPVMLETRAPTRTGTTPRALASSWA
ncbi:hypothetical protein OG481_00205 [Streptomyces longwoodensis]|nr:beta-ketoacyl synthase N-terminal-like domain-containing protein [Streptomyces longwoodensis]WRY87037.1 hypothetical protein OG481_00205 [Streptomyces longwoodensis]